jgi:hypothetical protein
MPKRWQNASERSLKDIGLLVTKGHRLLPIVRGKAGGTLGVGREAIQTPERILHAAHWPIAAANLRGLCLVSAQSSDRRSAAGKLLLTKEESRTRSGRGHLAGVSDRTGISVG